jgi:hypothetical protein
MKVGALCSLLDVIPPESHVRCVTRWLPRDIAAGVSDPEIIDVLEERGGFSLSLVDNLHAKLYIAGQECLTGSPNVTLLGLGQAEIKNIEVLVATTIGDPGVVAALAEIAGAERPATRALARAAQTLAGSLAPEKASPPDVEVPWFPCSRRPEHAYRFYSQPPTGYLAATERILLADVAKSNLQPGLDEEAFCIAIRSLLATIPISETILTATQDITLTRADAHAHLERIVEDDFSTNDLWFSFVSWMSYFFPDKVMKQEIAEIGLRRAQLLG